MKENRDGDLIDFGDVGPDVNARLQQGVLLTRRDRPEADRRFRAALALDPTALATYFCLYKIHAYQGALGEAVAICAAALREAARQANLPADWTTWSCEDVSQSAAGPTRFALYTLKAMAFVRLRRGEREEASACLAKLSELGQVMDVGASVVDALAGALA